jgi:orotidine-5'-phosphate decarboxylase
MTVMKDRIFVALDLGDLERAARIARALVGMVGGFKVGSELFAAHGLDGVRNITRGERLFLDLKFHDIPNTVAGAVRAVARINPFMLTVHASGGRTMMEAAVSAAGEAAERLGVRKPLILAVTVLTSLDDRDLRSVGLCSPIPDQVRRLAQLAQASGCDGVVCSPHELAALRGAFAGDFLLVVPGVRPAWAEVQDQKRVMMPAEAIAAGAHYLVMGRPITQASDPGEAARRIAAELSG